MKKETVNTRVCSICKAVRPEKFIKERKHKVGEAHGLPAEAVTRSVWYCKDKEDCVEKSKMPRYASPTGADVVNF